MFGDEFSDVRMHVEQLKDKLKDIPDDYIVKFHEHARADGALRIDEIIINHKDKEVLLGSIHWFKENVEKYGNQYEEVE